MGKHTQGCGRARKRWKMSPCPAAARHRTDGPNRGRCCLDERGGEYVQANRDHADRGQARIVGLSGFATAVAVAAVRGVLAEEEVYTWKDAAGRVHYGNRPPEGQAAKSVPLNAKPIAVQPTERIYTWTDNEGAVHYGARPPSDTGSQEIKEEDGSLSTIRSSRLRPGEQHLLQELPSRE